MSGGSFNYLDRITYANLDAIVARVRDIEDMAKAMAEYDGDRPAAAAAMTRDVAHAIRELDKRISPVVRSLGHIWHAVEWHRSGDWSEQQVHDALATMFPTLPPPPSAEGTPSA